MAKRRAAARHLSQCYPVVEIGSPSAGRRISAAVSGQRSSGKWHAAAWPSPNVVEPGSSTSHCLGWKRGQRGWKRQASGGLSGLGTSPSSTIG